MVNYVTQKGIYNGNRTRKTLFIFTLCYLQINFVLTNALFDLVGTGFTVMKQPNGLQVRIEAVQDITLPHDGFLTP